MVISPYWLFKERKLGLWRPGEALWSIIPDPVLENNQFVIKNTYFSDIISFEGKFYATTKEAMLIMIDPTTYKVRNLITVGLDLGYLFLMPYLVESNERLYLIYKDNFLSCDPDQQGYINVFMLEAHTGINKHQTYTWNVVTNLEDRVFFATDYVTFSITAEGLGWSKGNYLILPFHPFGPQRIHLFFSVDENLIDDDYDILQYFADYLGFYSLQDLKMYSGMKEVAQFTKIFWPPPD
ncbi:uncharacterized protein LOC110716521 [Chenopodium quinoa]|uniref:uncharacterized protein LOC110716521 n=1 Tax=Chenopodium quinoa TaxID=63459 RepID=UPI000B790D81|nr:uncharacterized protein LOC110716521 [Chenopodium quinoa]